MADPRLSGEPSNLNEAILDRVISHSVFLQRVKTGEVNKLVGFLNDKVVPDLLSQLETRLERIKQRGFDTSPATTKRVRSLIKEMNSIIAAGAIQMKKVHTADLVELSAAESAWMLTMIQSEAPVALSLIAPSTEVLRQVVTARPFQGKLLGAWWKTVENFAKAAISDQINIGLVQGESTAQIVRRVRGTSAAAFGDGTIAATRRHVEAVVRTSITHVSAQARSVTAQENTDVIKGERWVSTLDGHTTHICIDLDGRVFPVGKGIRPPAHVNCRSTITYIIKSWKELGINLKEAPVGTRASMDGQVPADITYKEWLARKGSTKEGRLFQNEVLGKRKAQLFRSNKINITRFTDSKQKVLTIKELEALGT